MGKLGVLVLALGLGGVAARAIKRSRSAASLLVVGLAVPMLSPFANAQTVSVPYDFTNGSAADANQVNANFDAVETQVNDNDSRITTAQSAADAAAAGHTTNTNTQLTNAQVAAAAAAEGLVAGASAAEVPGG